MKVLFKTARSAMWLTNNFWTEINIWIDLNAKNITVIIIIIKLWIHNTEF